MDNSYWAIIPARAGSKRVVNKNSRLLAGKPLIEYTLTAAVSSKRISKITVSTDDKTIATLSAAFNVDVDYPRPKTLASDTASQENVLKYIIGKYTTEKDCPENIILLQPTSPFRTSNHIDSAIDLFSKTGADTLTSVRIVKDHPFWLWKKDSGQILPLYDKDHIKMDRHNLPEYYIENGSIYITKRTILFNQGLYGSIVIPYIMSDIESIDIDEISDFEWAEFVIKRHLNRSL